MISISIKSENFRNQSLVPKHMTIEEITKRGSIRKTLFWIEMVLMKLIKADKRLAERIQQKLNFSNYQMLCLSWAIGLVMGIAIAIIFF